jgi:hypothetical protein
MDASVGITASVHKKLTFSKTGQHHLVQTRIMLNNTYSFVQ